MRKGATEQGEQRSQREPTGEAQRGQVGERKRRAGSSLGLGGPRGHPTCLCWIQGEENLIIQEKCRAAPGCLFWFPEPNYYWHIWPVSQVMRLFLSLEIQPFSPHSWLECEEYCDSQGFGAKPSCWSLVLATEKSLLIEKGVYHPRADVRVDERRRRRQVSGYAPHQCPGWLCACSSSNQNHQVGLSVI